MMTNLTPRPPTLALMLLAATFLTDMMAAAFIAGGISSSGSNIGRHHNHYRPPTALHSSVTWNNGNSYGKVRRKENISIIVDSFIACKLQVQTQANSCMCLVLKLQHKPRPTHTTPRTTLPRRTHTG